MHYFITACVDCDSVVHRLGSKFLQILLSGRGSCCCCSVALSPRIAASFGLFIAPSDITGISATCNAATIITASPGVCRIIGRRTASAARKGTGAMALAKRVRTAPLRDEWHKSGSLFFSPELCRLISEFRSRPATARRVPDQSYRRLRLVQCAAGTWRPHVWGRRGKQRTHGIVAMDGSDGQRRIEESCRSDCALCIASTAAASRLRDFK